jgi:hypothetical protein
MTVHDVVTSSLFFVALLPFLCLVFQENGIAWRPCASLLSLSVCGFSPLNPCHHPVGINKYYHTPGSVKLLLLCNGTFLDCFRLQATLPQDPNSHDIPATLFLCLLTIKTYTVVVSLPVFSLLHCWQLKGRMNFDLSVLSTHKVSFMK